MDMTINKFVEAYGKEILAEYSWAKEGDRLPIFMFKVREHLQFKRRGFDITGPCIQRAWKALGMKGRVTWKALMALE